MTFSPDVERRWKAARRLRPTLVDLEDVAAGEVEAKVAGLATDAGFPPTTTVEKARIEDPVDLARQEIKGHIRFLECCFLSAPDFAEGEYSSLEFESCHFHQGADLSGVVVAHRLTLSGCWAEARINMAGARAARLKLDGSTFNSTPGDEDEIALRASIMDVARSLTAKEATFYGEATFTGTKIGGELTLKGLAALRPGGVALSLREINVARSVHLHQVKVQGQLWLHGARIGGELKLCGAEVIHRQGPGRAIDALGATTGRWVDLDRTTICGPVRLSAARIGGKISVRRAVWSTHRSGRSGDRSLVAANVVVERDVDFNDGTQIEGSVFLAGAEIGGSLRFENVNLTGEHALNAAGAAVGGNFVWAPNTVAPAATIDLRDVTAGRLVDRVGSWGGPDQHNLVLSGLTYHSLGVPPVGGAARTEDRIRWLGQQKDFDMQPYRVLAEALKREGKVDDARLILLTGERDRLRRAELGVASLVGGRLLSVLTGFGYQLWRALAVLVVLFVCGWVYCGANRAAFRTESSQVGGRGSLVTAARDCPPDVHPCFSPWEYSLNAVVPALPLDQTDTWRPRGAAHHVTVALQTFGWVVTGALAAALARLYARPG